MARDVVAVLLMLAGLAGLGVAAWQTGFWLFVAYCSLLAAMAGSALGTRRGG